MEDKRNKSSVWAGIFKLIELLAATLAGWFGGNVISF